MSKGPRDLLDRQAVLDLIDDYRRLGRRLGWGMMTALGELEHAVQEEPAAMRVTYHPVPEFARTKGRPRLGR